MADFIAYAAFFGVFLGGRLGYILFYQIPKNNFQGWHELLADPLMVLRVWDGGMASHGGILGLMIFTWVYARKQKVSWTAVGDGLCVVAPIGIGLVRLANFINGELYGRVANGVSWAMKFPASLYEDLKYDQASINEAYYACRQVAPELGTDDLPYDAIVAPHVRIQSFRKPWEAIYRLVTRRSFTKLYWRVWFCLRSCFLCVSDSPSLRVV